MKSRKVVKLTTEKRTIIREKIVTKTVTRIHRSDLHIRLAIGVAVPRTVVFYPLPVEVVSVVPEYSGYLYFVLDDGTIVIVDPVTYEIVTMINV
jgi:hypothetical protein